MNEEQIEALRRHGYPPELPPRGVSGPPDPILERVGIRNRVCKLDGIEIDGHEGNDLDPAELECIHCYGYLLEFDD